VTRSTRSSFRRSWPKLSAHANAECHVTRGQSRSWASSKRVHNQAGRGAFFKRLSSRSVIGLPSARSRWADQRRAQHPDIGEGQRGHGRGRWRVRWRSGTSSSRPRSNRSCPPTAQAAIAPRRRACAAGDRHAPHCSGGAQNKTPMMSRPPAGQHAQAPSMPSGCGSGRPARSQPASVPGLGLARGHPRDVFLHRGLLPPPPRRPAPRRPCRQQHPAGGLLLPAARTLTPHSPGPEPRVRRRRRQPPPCSPHRGMSGCSGAMAAMFCPDRSRVNLSPLTG